MAEPNVQQPWVYTQRFDKANRAEFLATTRALEEADIWLLLACESPGQLYLSLIRPTQFQFALDRISRLTLRLDDSQPISLPAAAIEQKQIIADPRFIKDLMPLLIHSVRLSASFPEPNGTMHSYTFSLQPNDLALKDINVHCPSALP